MSDVYEWRTFEVGERVRVRLSPECNASWEPVTAFRGHPVELDGQSGVIDPELLDEVPAETQASHRYAVAFDSAVFVDDGMRRGWVVGGFFAAAELQPLGPAR